jgi:methylmalonyl-CoA/ethylmalonyl-CoA epimerase
MRPTENETTKKMFSDFVQIGVVVKDLDRTIKALTEIFGIGPFRTITYPPSDRKDIKRTYYSEPANYVVRQAFAELGPVELEILQPLEGQSIWADFLEEHGEGIHHIRFNVPDLEAAIEHLAKYHIEVSSAGSALRPGTKAINFNTQEAVGFTIEILEPLPGTDGRTPKIENEKVQL